MPYLAENIEVLDGLEAVRRRPAMYIGSTDEAGLHHLVFELVENAIDESLAGFCQNIEVVVEADGTVRVTDDGRGIPVGPHPKSGRPAAEVVLTTLHAGAKFGEGPYKVSGGLHGVGVSCVNALSTQLNLTIWREGGTYTQEFAKGKALGELTRGPDTKRTGTAIQFTPDREIFTGELSWARLASRVEELAFLHPGVSIRLVANGKDQTFAYEGGVAALVEHLNQDRRPLHGPFVIRGQAQGIEVDAALQWTQGYDEVVRSFANSIHTNQGGTHLAGLHIALADTFLSFAEANGLVDTGETMQATDLREGLTVALSIRLQDPHFGGQTKGELTNPEVTEPITQVVAQGLIEAIGADDGAARLIVGKAIEASRARNAARRASERAAYQAVDPTATAPIYQKQFGIRSATWHESAVWLTDKSLLDAHVDLLDVPPDAKALDVCCGSGVVGGSFKGKVGHITGLDLTAEMRALASTRLDHVDEGNVYDLPYAEDSYDLVVTREVLHLLPEPTRPLNQIFRVMKPGGQFIVGQILPYGLEDAAWMFRVFKKKQPLLFNQWQDHEYAAMLESVGFENIEMREVRVWESIDVWIDTWETTALHRHEIRKLFYDAPEMVRQVHPFEVLPDGSIRDLWRWCVFSARKPG